jgi:hypothetical protein
MLDTARNTSSPTIVFCKPNLKRNPGSKLVERNENNQDARAGLSAIFSKKWEASMDDTRKIMGSVAAQLMNNEQVILEGQSIRVKRVGSRRLRLAQFRLNGRMFEAIEQNPEKPSRWGRLAREKHQVVQFRDVEAHRYVAVSVDGEVKEYGRG